MALFHLLRNFTKGVKILYLHFLIFAGALRLVVKKAVGVGRFDHLDQDGSDLALQGQEAFGKGRRRHLDPAFVRRVDLQVMSVGRVKPQKAQPLGSSVLACRIKITANTVNNSMNLQNLQLSFSSVLEENFCINFGCS